MGLLPSENTLPLLPDPVQDSGARDKETQVNAALLRGFSSDEEQLLSDAVARERADAALMGTPTVRKRALSEFRARTMADLEAFVSEARGEDAGLIVQNPQAVISEFREPERFISDGDLAEATARAITTVDAFPTDRAATEARASLVAAELWERSSAWDIAGDVLGVLAVPDEFKDQSDILEHLGVNEMSYMDFAMYMKSLPSEDYAALAPFVIEAIIETGDGNDLKNAIRIHELLINPDPDVDLFNKGFDVLDWATYSLGVAKALKGLNLIRRLSKINKREAAGISEETRLNPELREELRVPEGAPELNVHPVNTERFDAASTDGLSHEIATQTELARAEIRSRVLRAIAEDRTLRGRFLTPEEEAAALERLQAPDSLDRLIAEQEIRTKRAVHSAEVLPIDGDSFKVQYRYADLDGPEEEVRTLLYSQKDTLGWNMEVVTGNKGLGAIEAKVASPNQWMDRLQDRAVGEAIVTSDQASIILEQLGPVYRDVYKGLRKKARDDVDAVLEAGDEAKTVYSVSELQRGVHTRNGFTRLSEKQISAYLKAREFWNSLGHIKNLETRKELTRLGYGGIRMKLRGSGKSVPETWTGSMNVIARPVARPDPDDVRVYVHDVGEVLDITDPRVQELLDSGHGYHRMRGEAPDGDGYVNLILARPTDFGDLPLKVLNTPRGYVLRQRKNPFRFLRVDAKKTLNGKRLKFGTPGSFRTMVKSSSERSLREFIQSDRGKAFMREAGLTEEEVLKGEGKFWRIDGDQEAIQGGDGLAAEQFGGIIGSPRASHKILDLTGEGRIPASEAAQIATRSIANTFTSSEFRLKMQSRWMKTFEPFLVNPQDGFFLARVKDNVAPETRRALEASRDWLKDFLRMPTEGESALSESILKVTKWMEKSKALDSGALQGVRTTVQRWSEASPVDALRSASFHSLLGFWNPAQVIVQASQAAVVMSMNPQNFPHVLRRGLALRFAAHFSKADNTEALKAVAKAFQIPEEEFLGMAQAFQKSGMKQGITANADYATATQGYSLTKGGWSRVLNSGLQPFYEGELVTRGYAFLDAGAEYFKKTGKSWGKLNDEDVLNITTEAHRRTFMLHRVNRAQFQKGVWSIPTQFWQITTKSMQNLLPFMFPGARKKFNFTARERRNILIGQLGLLGAAGVPGGNYLLQHASDMFNLGEADDVTQAAARQGVAGALMEGVLGTQLDLSSRVGLLNGMQDIYKILLEEEVPFAETAFGPAFSVFERGGEAFRTITPTLLTAATDWESLSTADLRAAGLAVARITSTFNNMNKAYMMMQYNEVPTKSGQALMEHLDDTAGWYQAIGFTPLEVSDAYQVYKTEKHIETLIREVADGVTTLTQDYYKGLLSEPYTPEHERRFLAAREILMESLPEAAKARVQKTVQQRLTETQMLELQKRALKIQMDYKSLQPKTVPPIEMNTAVNQ